MVSNEKSILASPSRASAPIGVAGDPGPTRDSLYGGANQQPALYVYLLISTTPPPRCDPDHKFSAPDAHRKAGHGDATGIDDGYAALEGRCCLTPLWGKS